MGLSHCTVEELQTALRMPFVGPQRAQEIEVELERRNGTTPVAQQPGALPLQIIVPWSALVSDNLHVAPIGAEARAKAATYREARDRLRTIMARQYEAAPQPGPVCVSVVLWPPNRQRRDATNVLKALADAMKGVLIADDCWAVAPEWTVRVGGVLVDEPKAIINIGPAMPGAR